MVASHVTLLAEILQTYTFQSFLYMSSTRGYRGSATTSEEAPWCLSPLDTDCLYDVAKLAGEALCLSLGPEVRIARLSSVYGSDQSPKTFLPSLVHDVRATGSVTIRLAPSSAKDYVHVDDACAALAHIAAEGRHRIYNVASGTNTSNAEIAELLTSKLHASVQFAPNAATVQLRRIDVSRLTAEFPWRPRPLTKGFVEAFVGDGGTGEDEDGH
jgi:nucleoside-diphosphate-sugar epimerase